MQLHLNISVYISGREYPAQYIGNRDNTITDPQGNGQTTAVGYGTVIIQGPIPAGTLALNVTNNSGKALIEPDSEAADKELPNNGIIMINQVKYSRINY